LIYLWEIHDLSGQIVGRYVGKANGGEKRPTRHYPRNVNKLLAGRPYKNGKKYRRVHFALADAVRAGHRISLTYLCNVSNVADILQVELRYIDHYGCNEDDGSGLNGRWKGTPREVVPVNPALLQEAEVEDSAPDLDDFSNISMTSAKEYRESSSTVKAARFGATDDASCARNN
jgi:hypothetical protein